jgi:uncharacterized protein (TIGR01777 family)
MKIAIAGGSGFIGRVLQEKLIKGGHEIFVLTRDPGKIKTANRIKAVGWLKEDSSPEEELQGIGAIVNLAGESINGRWTKEKKQGIVSSRIRVTREIIRIMDKMEHKPEVLINASAVGYYGMSETGAFTEESTRHAEDFLAKVAREWEEEAARAEKLGVRTVYTRFGVVLGNQGALPLMVLPYKWGVGGTIGSGRQWLSWIHVEDVAGIIHHAIQNKTLQGPLNVTAPHPVRMKEFGKTIASVLHRPHWLPVPGFALKMSLGEMSDMLLGGQKVIPEKAVETGYSFEFPELEPALRSILRSP